MKSAPNESVHKQFPSVNVLNLIHEDIREVSVNDVCRLKNVIEAPSTQIGERFIVKVDVGIVFP